MPLFFNLKDRPCLLVGGGAVALRKARLLQSAGARVTVVAPAVAAELAELAASGGGAVVEGHYRETLLEGKALVIAATDDEAVNQAVHRDATRRGVPVNVVDNPPLCSFIFPAIVDRSPIVVAISSGGQSPVLARLLRARLETLIPKAYSRLGALVGGYRERVRDRFGDINQRRGFWERVLQGPVAESVLAGREEEAATLLEAELEKDAPAPAVGEVYLVGAGPGDPELLTFKALRLMQQADVVLYDRLVSPEVVDLCRRDADRIYVGKERSNHAVPQEGINALLVRLAREGKRVLRLKGGDPFIFGRGGEELEELSAQGIPFQVVPGITAASASAAYGGIPLTHRDYAQSVKFVTGQLKNRTSDLNWPELVHDHQTIVFYMGLHRIEHLCRQMILHGKAPETPVAVVQAASTPRQKVLTATLETLGEALARNPMEPPSLIIVGEVVELHAKLAWFNEKAREARFAPLALREP
nr:siroheme synthase CysG [Motiliproteus sp. SC1-56]